MELTKRELVQLEAQERRKRILSYMTQDPPMPLSRICKAEGLHPRTGRQMVKEIEAEHGLKYMGVHSRAPKDDVPYGLTQSTLRLRQKLADNLYLLRERGKDSGKLAPSECAPHVGLNNREQIKAKDRPFAHDWTLSQIERLARALGRDPQEFILSCLTT